MGGVLAPLTVKDLAYPIWTFDPTWALVCTGIMRDPFKMTTFTIFGAPVVLTRGLGLVSTPVVLIVAPTSVPASNRAEPTTAPDREGHSPLLTRSSSMFASLQDYGSAPSTRTFTQPGARYTQQIGPALRC